MAVLGHRSENSIRSYVTKASLSNKRKMSEALSWTLSDDTEQPSDPIFTCYSLISCLSYKNWMLVRQFLLQSGSLIYSA